MSHSENRQPPLDEYATEASRSAARDHFVERFRLAQALLKAGISGAQVRRLVRSPTLELLLKYSPDQLRVPAGSGRTSGQWTTGATTGQPSGSAPGRQRPGSKHPVAAKPERYGRPKSKANPRPSAVPIALPEAPPSRQPSAGGGGGVVAAVSVDVLGPRNPGVDIGSLSEAALSGLAAFLRGLAISPAALAGAAVGGFGLSLIPTNAPLGRTVKLPGPGNVSVFQELDEPGLTFRYTTADGVQHEWMAAPAAGGVYLGPDGKVIARWTKIAGGLGLVVSAAALLNDDRPKLCPATVSDNHGPLGLAYEAFMKRLFNPGNPTPMGMAYGFHGPAGNLVKIDDCQQQTGILAEYKGPGYAYHLAKKDPVWRGQLAGMLAQAERQTEAAPGKTLIWFFSEWSVYREMTKQFAAKHMNIKVMYFPMLRERRRR